MKKMKLHTPNLTEANIERIREIFPNCVTEAHDGNGQLRLAVDFDQLRQELSDHTVEGPRESYHLNWPGKRQALLMANAPIAKTLRPCREESIDFDTTENLFIEGDNLDALKLLQETYLGKVKMIYIDPPYNTGKDFVYQDNFAESAAEYLLESEQKDGDGNYLVANPESNGRFHSDWLSMMYPRLKLARNLLKYDGVIFISIDDNEVSNLRKICDGILGEENFIAEFIWTGKSGSEDDGNIRNNHEYTICYCKSSGHFIVGLDKKKEDSFSYFDESKNDFYKRQLLRKWGDNSKREDRPNLYYPIKTPAGNEFYPQLPDGSEGCWRWSKDKMDEAISNGYIEFEKNRSGKFEAYEKIYKSDESRKTKKFQSLLNDASNTSSGTKELQKLFGNKKLFNHPKPLGYLNQFLKIANTVETDLILDFFSGSSTTAHAVMQLNAKDNGNRKFIMVQFPETCDEKSEAFKSGYKTIAEIGKERIRRAGRNIKDENAGIAPNLDIGFRVLKIDSSNMADVYYAPDAIEQGDLLTAIDNIKPGRDNPEDLLFQVMLDWGVDLTLPIRNENIQDKTVLFVDDNALIACFDTGITEDLVKELAAYKPHRVVFRDNGFASDAVKINVDQIFRQLSPTTETKSI